MDEPPLVITAPYYIEGDDCGYCHDLKDHQKFLGVRPLPPNAHAPSSSSHITIGCQVEQMSCYQYDRMVNLGFRRSGNFLYKGDMLRGCCRMYTIRTDLTQVKMAKEHRQVVNRFKRLLGIDEEHLKKGEAFRLDLLREAELQSTRFRTEFEPAAFSKEKFALFKKYQIHVHNDTPEEVTPKSFDRFLCLSPFLDDEIDGDDDQWSSLNLWLNHSGLPSKRRIGPTHNCYYFDEKLIAISVLDFLPSGVSSIYFIWDPDYSHLSLGTLSGLRELLLCSRLKLGYYYLGYYIDDCPKMRYKAKFGGELLDVCHDQYAPLASVKPFIDNGEFFVLKDPDEPAHNEFKTYNRCLGQRWPHDIYKDATDTIYKNPQVYDEAEDARKALVQKFTIGSLRLPDVLPGAIPMKQLLTEQTTLLMPLSVHLFDSNTGRMANSRFSNLLAGLKARVIDFVRIFGELLLEEAILIV